MDSHVRTRSTNARTHFRDYSSMYAVLVVEPGLASQGTTISALRLSCYIPVVIFNSLSFNCLLIYQSTCVLCTVYWSKYISAMATTVDEDYSRHDQEQIEDVELKAAVNNPRAHLVPRPSEDEDDPLNWPMSLKVLILIQVCWLAFVSLMITIPD